MESSVEITKALSQAAPEHQSAISLFVDKCGGIQLLSSKGMALINETRVELEQLYKSRETLGTSRQIQKTEQALEAVIAMLKEMTYHDGKGYPNNNYNFFSESQHAKTFYGIVFPPGTTAPEINDDLAAAVGGKLLVALEKFSPWSHLNKGVYFAYKLFPGSPVETAKTDLRERIDHYNQIGKDVKLVIVVNQAQNKLSKLLSAPLDAKRENLKTQYHEIVTKLQDEHFQFAISQPPGIKAVATGVLLPKIIACQQMLQEKFNIPLHELSPIEIKLPPPSDPNKFKGDLVRYCEKLVGDINKYIDGKKNIKDDKKYILEELRSDIQQRIKEIRSDKSPLPLADACLEIYACVEQTVSEHHRVAAGKSTSITLLNNAFAEVKVVAGQYAVNMTVASMAPAQAQKDKLGLADTRPKTAEKESVARANSPK
jgi:hypothetical protein